MLYWMGKIIDLALNALDSNFDLLVLVNYNVALVFV